jgi:hypothetical protein
MELAGPLASLNYLLSAPRVVATAFVLSQWQKFCDPKARAHRSPHSRIGARCKYQHVADLRPFNLWMSADREVVIKMEFLWASFAIIQANQNNNTLDRPHQGRDGARPQLAAEQMRPVCGIAAPDHRNPEPNHTPITAPKATCFVARPKRGDPNGRQRRLTGK